MAQLPASMRRKTRPAISSIHEKPPSPRQKMVKGRARGRRGERERKTDRHGDPSSDGAKVL